MSGLNLTGTLTAQLIRMIMAQTPPTSLEESATTFMPVHGLQHTMDKLPAVHMICAWMIASMQEVL
jgi:hypothetical protein